jgi:transcriptional regulator with XRE-family HTH domain
MQDHINNRFNTPHVRLRFLRSLTRLTRKIIAEKYNLPEVTLNKWETGVLSLSDKGITKCLHIYKYEGIFATEAWIKYGEGSLPYIAEELITVLHQGKDKNFANDINYFKKTYSDCIIFDVTEDEMLPFYKVGDIVIGCVCTAGYQNFNNRSCIVTLDNNIQILRNLIASEDNTQYNLHCINPLTKATHPILFNVKITQLAPVIWHGTSGLF